jgi:hypothetical protein
MITGQVKIHRTDIYISTGLLKKEGEVNHVFDLHESEPTIRVFENKKLRREYHMDTLSENPDLTGQFFHSSIRVLKNSAIMIDGIISKDQNKFPNWKDNNFEAIRLQPFFLSDNEQENEKLKGTGLFQRGLHFSGTVTPSGVRVICICDSCQKSFTLQHFHAGFSEAQYFYSTDSKKTLIVPYGQIEKMPNQLQETIDEKTLEEIEQLLPKSTNGNFKYYNSFRCPHCSSPFIDFEKHKDIRQNEYYGNRLINQEFERFEKG